MKIHYKEKITDNLWIMRWIGWRNPKPEPPECCPNEFYILPTIMFYRRNNKDFAVCFYWLGLMIKYSVYHRIDVTNDLARHKENS